MLALTPATAGAALQLGPCPGVREARCATLQVPLVRAGTPDARTLGVAVEVHRRRAAGQPSLGTIVAIAGEAGEGTTAHRDALLRLFRPLTARRDLVLVDRRGTGRSSAVRCAANAPKACAGRLGERATLLGSGAAAEDLLTVLDELAIPRADLYAAGYATVTAQAFAARHGDRLRSLVLDAPTVAGGDPWRRPSAAAYRRIVRAVCQASADCRAVKGDAAARLGSLAGRLARGPVAGLAHLTDLVALGDVDPNVLRELDAAIRAQRAGDRGHSPVWRRRRRTPRRRASTVPATPRRASTGRCPGARSRVERSRPFRAADWGSSALVAERTCAAWPQPAAPDPPVPLGIAPATVPSLVLSGELDGRAPPDEAETLRTRLANVTLVTVPATGHVAALDDDHGCASVPGARLDRRAADGVDGVSAPHPAGARAGCLPAPSGRLRAGDEVALDRPLDAARPARRRDRRAHGRGCRPALARSGHAHRSGPCAAARSRCAGTRR